MRWRMVLAAVWLVGCSSDARLKQISAKEVGCSAEEVVIEDAAGRSGRETWMALCDGQKFFCDEGEDGVMCAEELEKEDEAAEPKPTIVEEEAP